MLKSVSRKYISKINTLGVQDGDAPILASSKNLMVYLALLMSFGGLIWGSLLLYFALPMAALIPYGYVFISFFNVGSFAFFKKFYPALIIQILASMLLPFMLQWILGGFEASGNVMIWSLLALIGSVVLLRTNMVYHFLIVYALLVLMSVYFDGYFLLHKPEILTNKVSMGLIALNFILVISIFFVLFKIKMDGDVAINEELAALNQHKKNSLDNERSIRMELELSERRYRNLVEKSKVFICTHDLSGRLITVNKPGATMLGYQAEELIGKNISIFMPAEWKSDFQFYLEYIQEHRLFESFMTIFTKSGEKRVLLFRNSLIDEAGREPYILGSAQDVTEWRKSEFRESKLRKELQLIISSMDDFVVDFDDKGCFKNLWCRDETKLFMPVSEFIGKSILEAFPHVPEFALEAQRFYNEAVDHKERRTVEIEDIFSKEPLFYLARMNPIIEPDGSCIRCTVLVTNITDRKLAQANLMDAFNTQTVLIESLEGAVLVEDANRHIQVVNPMFCKLFDISADPKEMIGLDCSESAYQAKHLFMEADSFPLKVKEILQARMKVLNEEVIMADGRIFERDYIPILSQDKYKGHLWHYREITKRKQFEITLKLAKEEAENANRLKTIFMGNLSHEVRTPLQGIQGFSEILENPDLEESKRVEYLDIIKKRSVDLQNIIDSLLDMASLETGEIKSFPKELKINEFIDSVFESLKQDHSLSLKDKAIELIMENRLVQDLLVNVDPTHLKQVISNIINNAIKFTNQGFVRLSAYEEKSHILISVSDTGIGISKDRQTQIFEPFRQAHEGLSRSEGGIGLGLSICKKMVELWGGQIELDSEAGAGTTITFTIPN